MSSGCFHPWVVILEPLGTTNSAVESLCVLTLSWVASEWLWKPAETLSFLFFSLDMALLSLLSHVPGLLFPLLPLQTSVFLFPLPAVLLFPFICMSSSHLCIHDFCALSSGCLPQCLEDISGSYQPGIATHDSTKARILMMPNSIDGCLKVMLSASGLPQAVSLCVQRQSSQHAPQKAHWANHSSFIIIFQRFDV